MHVLHPQLPLFQRPVNLSDSHLPLQPALCLTSYPLKFTPNFCAFHRGFGLADCWERTKGMTVPQFQDSECKVRRLWDEAVAEAMGWDVGELARLRHLLHQEPHVRGLGYGQYTDEADPSEEPGPSPI